VKVKGKPLVQYDNEDQGLVHVSATTPTSPPILTLSQDIKVAKLFNGYAMNGK